MINITPVESLTIASLTLTFYAFFASLLSNRKDNFSRILFIVLIVNILGITLVIYNVLNGILTNTFLLQATVYSLFISWHLSVAIVLFAFMNFFILDLKKIHDKTDYKLYLYTIITYVLIFLIFVSLFSHIQYEIFTVLTITFFFIYLIVTHYMKDIEEDSQMSISIADEIKKAEDLLNTGIINDEEFARIKEKYLK